MAGLKEKKKLFVQNHELVTLENDDNFRSLSAFVAEILHPKLFFWDLSLVISSKF